MPFNFSAQNSVRLLRSRIPISVVLDDPSPPPWFANGVVYQFPQSWALGFTSFYDASRYLIDRFGYNSAYQLWNGYTPLYNSDDAPFTVKDFLSVLIFDSNGVTLYAWVSRNALPYARFIVQNRLGFQPTSQWGPIVPATQLSPFLVDSSTGPQSVSLQYVAYVPDVSMKSGSPAFFIPWSARRS